MEVSVEVRVLGPFELADAGGVLRLPGAKQRRLLVGLIVHAGEAVSSDEIIDIVWGETPPQSAPKLIQVYVSQLRKALPNDLTIETRGGGYAVMLDPGSLDAARFERLLNEAIAVRREDNPELTASLLERALALWRGRAYGEFAYNDFARAEAERLEGLRMLAVEARFEAGLAIGRHAELLPELQSVAEEQPLREGLQALAMLALYRGGRQTDALQTYSDTRERLLDELGLEPGGELQDMQRRILQQDPSLMVARAPAVASTRLPTHPNPLLGRERELDELTQLLLRDDVRLLVLTGAGGSGKTRLALEAANRVARSFANGAAFIELAPLRDPGLIVDTMVRALRIEHPMGEEPMETLTAYLHPRQMLLVLDNAEHLHEGMTVISELLMRAPRISLLVTSRTVLHLSAEHVYPVQPLDEEPALALFLARARQADPHFDPDGVSEAVIRRICERLDGLPLAIELAAPRATTQPASELLEKLDARLPLLTGGPRDLPARQQTLHAALAWSFDLLAGEVRALAARLAVFVGRFDLTSAEAVCDATLDELTSLVEKSLLQRTDAAEFGYLETVREYALEELLRSPDADNLRRKHFHHFLALAERADLSAVRRGGGERLDLATAAQDNLRAALAWTIESGSVALGLELATAMERYWVTHDPREGMRWFAALFRQPEVSSVAPVLRAHALRAYGSATDIAGDDDDARKLYEHSLALFEQLGDERGRAALLHRLSISALRRGDLDRARALVEESHRIHEQTGDRWGQTQTVGTLGAIERDAANTERARELFEQCAAMAREAGVRWWEGGAMAELAALALSEGKTDNADSLTKKSLEIADAIGDRGGRVLGVGLAAALAAERGHRDRAERLWSAVANEQGVAPLGGWRRHRRDLEPKVHVIIGDHHPAETISLDDAVALALRAQP
jgi:predicted ATPase/DNA-binding SARP family transcriptional activator